MLYAVTGGADGGIPHAPVTVDSAGDLYGTTASGGAPYSGMVYKIGPSGGETTLYNFKNGVDGGYPSSGLILDSAGNVYGTATG